MKKKIAILATFVGEVNRGAETFVIELTKKLRAEFDVTVFSKSINEEIKENIKTVDFKLPFCINVYKSLYNKVGLYRKICNRIYYLIPDELIQYRFSKSVYKNHLLKEKYDLIFPNNGIWGARVAQRIRKLNGTPFIYTGHGGNGAGEIKILELKPDKYIALTERYKKWAEKYYDSIVKIHNGVAVEKFNKSIVIKEEHKNLQRPVILCAGAFNEMKRQKLLIDAFALLNEGYLILLGTGEHRDEIKKYCEGKIKGRYIIDSVDYKDMYYYYNLCDIFSLPSKDEPFGIVYAEAMSANKPVVTTDDETRREIIGDAGILTDVENPALYSKALLECFERDWKNVPLDRAINCFNWDKISKEYESLINDITNDK